MEGFVLLIVLLVAVGFVWFLLKRPSSVVPRQAMNQPQEGAVARPQSQSVDVLRKIIDTCEEVGADGFSSLIIAASANGKVSRDELRSIMWFCECRGASFSDAEIAHVSQLNSGVSMSVGQGGRPISKIVSEMGACDLMTLVQLYALHVTIGKPWNKTAKRGRDVLAVLEEMIASVAQQPSKGVVAPEAPGVKSGVEVEA